MRIVSYFGIGVATRIVSWKTSSDPATGTFSLGIDPRTFMQAFIWRGSEPYWRSNAWNGSVTFTENEDNESISSFYITSLSGGKQNMSWSYMVTQGFPATRLMIEETGFLRLLTWQEASKSWVTRASYPNMEFGACVLYNQCGPNGLCVGRNATLSCKCFAEFSPNNSTEWAAGNYSGGCVKKTRWDCSKGGFYKVYSKMKLPDGMLLLRDAEASECEANCSATCNCTAYSFDSTRSIESTTRCLVWLGDMIDLVQNSSGMDELHVRVSAADLDNNSQYDGHSHKRKRLLVIMLAVGTAAMLLSGTTCYFMWARHMRLGKTRRLLELTVPDSIGSDKGTINAPLVDFFSIRKATDDFAVTNKLGEGGFGSVYKGRLEDGQFIAVKRLSENSKQGFEELNNEVKLIVRLQHTNLVRLLGWCIHENEKMLIYEYMPNKSLDKYLFDSNLSTQLDWHKRFCIIQGIAQGLLYLHRYSRLRIIHRDLKTSNILLDENMIPKISDFGLARIFGESHMEQNTRRVVGTFGYMAPEYGLHGRFSEKSDVYSFGVIVLEIISGKRNSGSYSINDSFSLLGYVSRSFYLHGVFGWKEEVANWSTDRPTMDAIAIMLVNKNPVLPSPQQPAHASTTDSPTLIHVVTVLKEIYYCAFLWLILNCYASGGGIVCAQLWWFVIQMKVVQLEATLRRAAVMWQPGDLQIKTLSCIQSQKKTSTMMPPISIKVDGDSKGYAFRFYIRLLVAGLQRSFGIGKSVIKSLLFSALNGVRVGLECAICLAKFADTELLSQQLLRLLPKTISNPHH
ncbi:hypothetical protein ZIOFF_054639 [Zingiber officinale]|uniref:non-specific serine/threonine protein kinase n=1 Tax=Zingiber officinale TaxID=94328 RepID=A0A8J5FDV9_ZINOF|nr:hypothetical protein ZIOFF_054639 [Zingiber officinale]